jgi:7-cyano-7-deazaguanine synthase
MKPSALVCLSGGLDSAVSLLWAKKEYKNLSSLFFNYKQKALIQERKASKYFAKLVGAEFIEINLGFLGDASNSSLNKDDQSVPSGDEVRIGNKKISVKTAKSVWVPNRNGLFISVAASMAEARNIDEVVLGFNKEEALTFPDNSRAFVKKTNEALKLSTKNQVRVVSPTIDLDKIEIFNLGLKLGLDSEKVWSCYKSGESICGECESCKRFLRAKKESKVLKGNS